MFLSELTLDQSIQQALSAYDEGTLILPFIGSRGVVESLPDNRIKASLKIQELLEQGYTLVNREEGFCYLTRGLLGGGSLSELEKKLNMKPASQRSVFITYQWAQKEIAQALHNAFEAKGYLVIRDESSLSYGVYLPGFMRIIGHPNLDYVLPVVSKSYLESKSCMYEVNQIVKRYQWEKSLLPYVVSTLGSDLKIYDDGSRSYLEYWQQEYDKETDGEKREVIENIQRNIRPFVDAIVTRINIPESELIETQYKALFEMIEELEKDRDHGKFQEIQELLGVASFNEIIGEFEECEQAFQGAIKKVKEVQRVAGVNKIAAVVYRSYGEYLCRQQSPDAQKQLAIAVKFENQLALDERRQEAERIAAEQRQAKARLEAEQAKASKGNVVSFPVPTPSKSSVNSQEVSQFLEFVAQGWQEKAAGMIQKMPELLLARGTVNDLAGRCSFRLAASKLDATVARLGNGGVRTFEGITAFQYALWALDLHMAMMLRGELDRHYPGEAAIQASECDGGRWVSSQGIHAGPHLQRLIQALDVYTKMPWDEKKCEAQWCKQVGGAQLLLPWYVLNEYCHPTRSFDPTPDFSLSQNFPRSRRSEVYDGKQWVVSEDAVSAPVSSNKCLGSDFGFFRGGLRGSACGVHVGDVGGFVVACWMHGCYGVCVDLRSLTSLLTIRSQQREELLTELSQYTGLEGKRKVAALK